MKIIYFINIDGYIKYEGDRTEPCIYEISEQRWNELKILYEGMTFKECIPCSIEIISEIEKRGKPYAPDYIMDKIKNA